MVTLFDMQVLQTNWTKLTNQFWETKQNSKYRLSETELNTAMTRSETWRARLFPVSMSLLDRRPRTISCRAVIQAFYEMH